MGSGGRSKIINMKLNKTNKLTILAVFAFMAIMGYKIFHKSKGEE